VVRPTEWDKFLRNLERNPTFYNIQLKKSANYYIQAYGLKKQVLGSHLAASLIQSYRVEKHQYIKTLVSVRN
jgi:hypothetical protein